MERGCDREQARRMRGERRAEDLTRFVVFPLFLLLDLLVGRNQHVMPTKHRVCRYAFGGYLALSELKCL
jgi:hypothetical protein